MATLKVRVMDIESEDQRGVMYALEIRAKNYCLVLGDQGRGDGVDADGDKGGHVFGSAWFRAPSREALQEKLQDVLRDLREIELDSDL